MSGREEAWDRLPSIVKLAVDFDRAVRESLSPKQAEKYIAEQRAVADCRRRAATNSRLLNLRIGGR